LTVLTQTTRFRGSPPAGYAISARICNRSANFPGFPAMHRRKYATTQPPFEIDPRLPSPWAPVRTEDPSWLVLLIGSSSARWRCWLQSVSCISLPDLPTFQHPALPLLRWCRNRWQKRPQPRHRSPNSAEFSRAGSALCPEHGPARLWLNSAPPPAAIPAENHPKDAGARIHARYAGKQRGNCGSISATIHQCCAVCCRLDRKIMNRFVSSVRYAIPNPKQHLVAVTWFQTTLSLGQLSCWWRLPAFWLHRVSLTRRPSPSPTRRLAAGPDQTDQANAGAANLAAIRGTVSC